MPKHEVVVERIPQEFQGERLHIPPSMEPPHIVTWTVTQYQSHHPNRQVLCPECDTSFDISSLERVWDEWGPDAVITVKFSHILQPGESRPKRDEPPFQRAQAEPRE